MRLEMFSFRDKKCVEKWLFLLNFEKMYFQINLYPSLDDCNYANILKTQFDSSFCGKHITNFIFLHVLYNFDICDDCGVNFICLISIIIATT